MRIVFKPMGVALLIATMACVLGIAIYQQQQLRQAQRQLTGAQSRGAVASLPQVAPNDGLQNGIYQIQAKHSRLYLETRNDSSNPATEGHITQGAWRDNANQKWRLIRLPDGAYNIQNTRFGFWLDDTNAVTAAGDYVRQWFAVNTTTNNAQKWQINRQEGGTYQIRCVASGKVLEVHDASRENGAVVYQEEWTGKDEQRFLLTRLGD
jgi:hypothetical protein